MNLARTNLNNGICLLRFVQEWLQCWVIFSQAVGPIGC
jgi:hypothetical protein